MMNVSCCECGVVFGMPEQLNVNLRQSHAEFYCPNGHRQSYRGETAEQKRIASLETTIQSQRKSLDMWMARAGLFKCPMPRCSFGHKDKQTLREHLIRVHKMQPQETNRLAAHAGPDAHGGLVKT